MKEPNSSKVSIRVADQEDYLDIELAAKEFVDLIKDFRKHFEKEDFFVLLGYYEKNIAGILVSQRNNIVRSIENILPTTQIHFLYVNSAFRGRNIGSELLNDFIRIQKKKNTALIFIELFKNNTRSIEFFEKFGFSRDKIDAAKIHLTKVLWDDYGMAHDEFFETFI